MVDPRQPDPEDQRPTRKYAPPPGGLAAGPGPAVPPTAPLGPNGPSGDGGLSAEEEDEIGTVMTDGPFVLPPSVPGGAGSVDPAAQKTCDAPIGLMPGENSSSGEDFDPEAATIGVVPPEPPAPRTADEEAAILDTAVTNHFGKDYTIEGRIARGGMGQVWGATESGAGREVVIKLLGEVRRSSSLYTRFRRESTALGLLRHPNIVRIYDSGTIWLEGDPDHPMARGRPWLVMERIPGQNLYDLVRHHMREERRPPALETIRAAFVDVAAALATCHDRGLIHRDIKPANIMIEDDTGRAVLLDFGLVRVDKAGDRSLGTQFADSVTKSGQAVGTPAFCPPEQLFGRKEEISTAADVWGFGASLYFCLAGRLPFDARSPEELADSVEEGEPTPLREANPSAPAWLEELCRSCLQHDPAMRPSIREIEERLRRGETTRLRRAVIGAVALCALLAVVWIAVGRVTESPMDTRPLVLETWPRRTESDQVLLRGVMNFSRPGTVLVRQEDEGLAPKRVAVGPDGVFETRIELPIGDSVWLLTPVDSTGRRAEPVVVAITRRP